MGVNISWDNGEKTALRYDFKGRWTWEEFDAAALEAFAMTGSVTHTVDSISNFEIGATLPPNALFQFRRAMSKAPPNRGITVIVGGSLFIKTMVTTFSRLNKQLGERLQIADSLEQARALLAARRPKSSSKS